MNKCRKGPDRERSTSSGAEPAGGCEKSTVRRAIGQCARHVLFYRLLVMVGEGGLAVSGKVFDEYGVPIVTPVRVASAVVAGVAVVVVGAVWGDPEVLLVGVAVIVVVFCVAIPVWRNRRYRDRPLARPPVYAPIEEHSTVVEVGRRRVTRRVVRRPAGVGYLFSALGGLLCLALMIRPAGSIDAGIVLSVGAGAAICVGSLATGPAAYFVVSGRFLDSCTANRIVRVPRQMISEFVAGRQDVTLRLTSGPAVYFRVDSVLWALFDKTSTFTNPRSQVRTIDRIVAAMHHVPPVRVLGDTQVQWIPRRRVVTGLAVGGLVLFAVTIIRTS